MARYNYFMPKSFGGKDLRKTSDPLSRAVVCDNFRFSEGMGLRARCGYTRMASLSAAVRGLTSVTLGGKQWLIAAAGDTLYAVSDGATELGRLARSQGRVLFFVYDDKLVIFDGNAGFVFDSESLSPISPYVPLIANRSSTTGEYVELEPTNCMTDLVRVRFHTIKSVTDYSLPSGVCELLTLTAPDGNPVTNWEFDDNHASDSLPHVTFTDETLDLSGTYEALCRTDQSVAGYAMSEKLYSARFAEVFGRVTEPRIYLFSSGERGRVYYDRKPNSNYYSGTDMPLYFCAENSFTVGQGEEEICGACRFLDRLFVFTEKDAWFITASTTDEAYPLHSNAGCAVIGGAIPLDNNPVTVGRDGIYLWENVSGYTECSADFVSSEILAELNREMISSLSAVGVCRARSELWLCPDSAHGGGAVIWDYRRGIFYRFSGFQVSFIAEYGSDIVFASGKVIYGFSETAGDDDGTPITAVWENAYSTFSDYPARLRLHRAAFTVYPDGGEVSLSAICDNGRTVSATDDGIIKSTSDPSVPLTFERRVKSGNFHRGKLRLTSIGGRSEIVSAALGIEVRKDRK